MDTNNWIDDFNTEDIPIDSVIVLAKKVANDFLGEESELRMMCPPEERERLDRIIAGFRRIHRQLGELAVEAGELSDLIKVFLDACDMGVPAPGRDV